MKTVGYVLAEFPVLSETFVGNEMRAMQLIGHRIAPIAMRQPSQSAQPDDALLTSKTRYVQQISWADVAWLCARHPIGFCRAAWLASKQTGIRAASVLLTAAKVAVAAKQQGCEHLHAHFALQSAIAALVAGRWLNLGVSFVGHGYDVYATPADLPLKLTQADFVIAVCQQMEYDFLEQAPSATIELMPCGIELDKFQFRPTLQHNQRLLFIGRLAEKKGLPNLLQALAAIPADQRPALDIVGDGPMRAVLEQQIAQTGLQDFVQFLGAKTADWIRSHGSAYLGLVAPFQIAANGDRDTGPLVLKEAMALGLPVISSALMGCNEILDARSGYLVPPQNSPALTSAILLLQQQTPYERQQMVRYARSRVERKFNVADLCQRLSLSVEALP